MPKVDWRSSLDELNKQGPLYTPQRLLQLLRLRGGSTTREEIERRMREEREKEVAKEAEIKERQEKRRMEKEYAEQRQLAAIEEDTKAGALVQRRRKLPEVMTLESLRTYALELLADGELEEAVEALERVLVVDPFDVQTLFALAQIMHDTRQVTQPSRHALLQHVCWQMIPTRTHTDTHILSQKKRHKCHSSRGSLVMVFEQISTHMHTTHPHHNHFLKHMLECGSKRG